MQRFVRPLIAIGAAIGALLLPVQPSFAWGPEAHRTIALIADQLLRKSDPAAHAKVLALLATDKGDRLTKTDIASEATWADVLREKSPEARTATTAWHSTRLKPDSPDLAAACFGHTPLPSGYPASHGPQNNCSVDKIAQFETELKDQATSPAERLVALQFLLNLVGDLHDPLQAIDHADRGGKCTAVQVGSNPPMRLQTYWEQTLVHEVVGADPARGAAHLAASLPAAELAKWASGSPQDWAQETYQIAKTVTYGFAAERPAGNASFPARKGETGGCASVPLYRVGPDYETKALAAVKERLTVAGVRLAAVLRDSMK